MTGLMGGLPGDPPSMKTHFESENAFAYVGALGAKLQLRIVHSASLPFYWLFSSSFSVMQDWIVDMFGMPLQTQPFACLNWMCWP